MAVRRVKSAILAVLLFCAVVITSLAALAETRAAGSEDLEQHKQL